MASPLSLRRALCVLTITGFCASAQGAGHAHKGGKVAEVVDKLVGVFKNGREIEARFARGEITQEQREMEHAKNVAGSAGGWVGGAAGGFVAAYFGPAEGPAALIIVPVGVAVGTVAGEEAGEAIAE